METTDVDPDAPDTGAPRYSVHLFTPDRNLFLGDPRLRTGHPLRVAANTDDWQPDVLFDFAYGAAVLHNFGVPALTDGGFATAWNGRYYAPGARIRSKYPDVSSDASDGSGSSGVMKLDWRDPFDRVLMLPYIMMQPQDAQEFFEAQKKEHDTEQRAELEDKVGGWRGGVADAADAAEGRV